MSYYERVKEASEFIKSKIPNVPEIAIILGSGLGSLRIQWKKKLKSNIQRYLIFLCLLSRDTKATWFLEK